MPPQGRRTKLSERTDYGGAARRAARRGDYNQFERRLANIDYDQKKGFSSGVDDRKIWSKKGDRDYGERWDVKLGRNISGMAGDIKDFVTPPGLASLIPSFGRAVKSQARAAENEEILGDLYTNNLREEMMTGDELEYYNKYKDMAAVENDNERKQYYLDQANTALRNASMSNRVNYALDDLGFDTSAVPAVPAFGEPPGAFEERTDYGGLSNKLQSGLEGTIGGRRFLEKHAILKDGDTDYMRRTITDFNKPVFEAELPIVPKIRPKPPFDDDVTTTVLPGEEYGVELPAYFDGPTSILEDYDAQDLGGPLRWRVGDAFHPIDTSGYPDRDLERDEWIEEQLAEMASLRDRDPNTLPGWKYTDVNPFTTPYVPIEGDPWTETHPDLYDFQERNYGPVGMDPYWGQEEEEIRGLWGPQYYPDQLGPVDR
jgi:hypothetical protein